MGVTSCSQFVADDVAAGAGDALKVTNADARATAVDKETRRGEMKRWRDMRTLSGAPVARTGGGATTLTIDNAPWRPEPLTMVTSRSSP